MKGKEAEKKARQCRHISEVLNQWTGFFVATLMASLAFFFFFDGWNYLTFIRFLSWLFVVEKIHLMNFTSLCVVFQSKWIEVLIRLLLKKKETRHLRNKMIECVEPWRFNIQVTWMGEIYLIRCHGRTNQVTKLERVMPGKKVLISNCW